MTLGSSLRITLLNHLDKLLPIRTDQRLDPQPRRVDRALARVYQDVVKKASKSTADEWTDHGDLCNVSMYRHLVGLPWESRTQK